jgi:putative DNA primase/helicase
MSFTIHVQASANGHVHRRAKVMVRNEDGSRLFGDKADLDDMRELDKLAQRFSKRLKVPVEDIKAQLEQGWNRERDRLEQEQQERHKAEAKEEEKPTCPAADEIHLTDVGNGKRFVMDHGANFRHCYPWKRDLIWAGTHWQEDEVAQADLLAKTTILKVYRDAAAEPNDDRRTKLIEHALDSEDARRIRAMVTLARSEPGIPVLPAGLDCDQMLLNVLNGTIDLRTAQFRTHRREDLITKLAPVQYDPDATCPVWDQFALWAMGDRKQLLDYLQRVVGYCLTGDVSEQCLWFLYGLGANGKTTFIRTIMGLMGSYAWQAVPELLLQKKHEAHPTERADLFGRRFVATIEVEEGKRIAEALMKLLTGNDVITARRCHQNFFTFVPTHKLFLVANHKPVVRGTDHGTWRRIKLIPFTATIQESAKDPELLDKLKAEWPGILRWAVEGCLAWQRDGLGEPNEVTEATAEYRGEQDLLAGFIAEVCFVHVEAKAQTSVLYERYQEWSGDRETSQKAFTRAMEAKGYLSEAGHGNRRFYKGIGLPT